jgi:hypothetical protein
MKSLPYLSVLYEEGQPETYKGVQVDFGGRIEVFSQHGWPQDLGNAELAISESGFLRYLHSSSLDNFRADFRGSAEA